MKTLTAFLQRLVRRPQVPSVAPTPTHPTTAPTTASLTAGPTDVPWRGRGEVIYKDRG